MCHLQNNILKIVFLNYFIYYNQHKIPTAVDMGR